MLLASILLTDRYFNSIHSVESNEMKKLRLTTVIAVFLLFCVNNVQAQTTETKFDQVELYKQFIGLWKCDYAEDTTFIWETKYFGGGFEVNMKWESKREIVTEVRSVVGYDKKNDMLIEAMIMNYSPSIDLWSIRFSSPDKYEEIPLGEISDPEKATQKDIVEFKSPDLFTDTYIINNKIVKIDTLRRMK